MAFIDYPASSVYTQTPQLPWRIGRYVHRSIPPASGDEPFIITSEYALRPDKLAAQRYGSPHYLWVFVLRNPNVIRDPIFDFVEGTSIIVPSPAHVRSIFG